MRWSEAVTLEFVKIYLKHECLWNPAHPGYKLRYQRERAYGEICSEFKLSTMKTISIPEVKMKIKNLRTTYVQQVHKILLKSSPDEIYEPSLVWFHEMDSCLKHVTSNRQSNAYNLSKENEEADSACQIWVEEGQNDNTDVANPDSLVPQTDDEYESNKQNEQMSKVNVEKQSLKAYYKKLKKKKLKHRTRPVRNYSTDSSSDCARDDEFDIYGKYIASQLKKMELYKAIRLQLQIQNLISEARMSDIVTSD